MSMPRFRQSRKFKGFAFVEFATRSAAAEALKAIETQSDPSLAGYRAMPKVRWLDLKEKMMKQLEAEGPTATDGETQKEAAEDEHADTAASNEGEEQQRPPKRQKRDASDSQHI